jgi:hypothetical protein
MTSDAKTKKPTTKAAPAQQGGQARAKDAATPTIDREAALAVAAGLTEAERDLVAGILDWQLEGLGRSSER